MSLLNWLLFADRFLEKLPFSAGDGRRRLGRLHFLPAPSQHRRLSLVRAHLQGPRAGTLQYAPWRHPPHGFSVLSELHGHSPSGVHVSESDGETTMERIMRREWDQIINAFCNRLPKTVVFDLPVLTLELQPQSSLNLCYMTVYYKLGRKI